jgi:ribokinase
VVVGGANLDYLVRGKRLPTRGATVAGTRFQDAPGGKGANQAVGAARLGARVAFIGRVGQDRQGDRILAALDREGVDRRGVSRDRRERTGVALVMVDDSGDKQILTAPGANVRLTRKLVERQSGSIRRARVLLVQLEVPLAAVERAVQLARRGGALVVLDPAPPRRLPKRLLRQIDLLRCNADEARVVTGHRATTRAGARRAAGALLRAGVGAALIGTAGGNLLVGPNGERWLAHLEVRAVDATGAGDACSAALAVELARGASLEAAARFAAAAAAAKTTVLGAQAGLPTRARVNRLLRRRG